MNTTKDLRWGIIGAGIIANTMADAIKTVSGNQLLAVASKTPDKAKVFAERHNVPNACSYNEIVNNEEIDIIYVATTHNFHFENAKLALKHGKHVLIEKPFTVNASEARELVQIAKEKNLFLMEAIWTRFLPSVKLLKEKIANNEIGEIKQINISFGYFVAPEYQNRLKEPSLAGGATLDLGIYPISFACYMLGELPQNIKSMTCFSESGVDETSNYMFQFPSGCLTNICTSYVLKMKNTATIYGTNGHVEFPDFQYGERFTINVHDRTNDVQKRKKIRKKNNKNGFVHQVEEVASCVNMSKLESDIIPLDETIGIMEVMDKMRAEWGLVYPFE